MKEVNLFSPSQMEILTFTKSSKMPDLYKKSISLDTAGRLAHAAINKANELGFAIALTIVDESGVIKLFVRMDHAPLIANDASRKKAITAVGFGLPTGKSWFDYIKDDPILREGAHDLTDFMLMGGGVPIVSENQVIGAIGVSGGHHEKDQECAHAALNSLK
jgi:uncharacterized protein GlcG (DUF336 family)